LRSAILYAMQKGIAMGVDLKIYDLVIVGGGPVGLFASFYAGRRNMSTLIIEASDSLGGLPQTIYSEKWILDIPGFSNITGYDLSKRLIEQAQSDYLTIRTNTKVKSYQGDLSGGFTLHCEGVDGSEQIQARTILLATGVGQISSRKIGVPGEEEFKDNGVYYSIKSKDSVRGNKVVVVGGGDSALDWVDLIHDVASEIHLVHRREDFRAQEESVRRLMSSKVQLHLNAEVKAIEGSDAVQSVQILYKQGHKGTIPCEVVIVAFGFHIELDSLEQWGLKTEKEGVVVNHSMETNIPGVFAAGDVAFTPGIGTTKLIAIGFGQGTISVNTAKSRIDPKALFYPGHSTNWK
jgi:thioredoxin reductase